MIAATSTCWRSPKKKLSGNQAAAANEPQATTVINNNPARNRLTLRTREMLPAIVGKLFHGLSHLNQMSQTHREPQSHADETAV